MARLKMREMCLPGNGRGVLEGVVGPHTRTWYTVNKGHFGGYNFVPCREGVPMSKVLAGRPYLLSEVPLYTLLPYPTS